MLIIGQRYSFSVAIRNGLGRWITRLFFVFLVFKMIEAKTVLYLLGHTSFPHTSTNPCRLAWCEYCVTLTAYSLFHSRIASQEPLKTFLLTFSPLQGSWNQWNCWTASNNILRTDTSSVTVSNLGQSHIFLCVIHFYLNVPNIKRMTF